MTTTPTASTFREPLLRALGTATGLVADTPVKMRDTLPLVYANAGMAEDAHGKDNNGWFKVRLWVQQCYKALRKQDLAIKAGRGQWGLSAEGVKAAALLMGQPAPATPAPTTSNTPAAEDMDLDALLDELSGDTDASTVDAIGGAQDAPVAVLAPDPASTPAPVVASAHGGGEGVSWSVGEQVNTYNADPYIRGLAIESTECFGHHSARSTVCQGCPLSGACKAFLLSKLSEISAKLHARDAEAIRRASMPATPEPAADEDIDDIIAAIEEEVEAPKTATGKGERMKIPADGKCRECSKKIPRGDECMYVRGAGTYHLTCYDKT